PAPLPSSVNRPGASGEPAAATGSDPPAPVSIEMFNGVPGPDAGHTKSTRSGEAYTRGAYVPLTFTREPASSTPLPEGSEAPAPLVVSHRPRTPAREPALQTGEAALALLAMPVIAGSPEPTTMLTVPVEDNWSELVAVNMRS